LPRSRRCVPCSRRTLPRSRRSVQPSRRWSPPSRRPLSRFRRSSTVLRRFLRAGPTGSACYMLQQRGRLRVVGPWQSVSVGF
jgi:hypothetical protein